MIHRFIDFISFIATYLIDHFGILGIFIGMVLESACIPLPSEVIMLTGGFFVEKGMFNFWEVAFTGVIGNLVGSIIIYWIGAKGARSILEKYGKYIFLNEKHLSQAENWFAKYGEWTVFFARNLPFIRTFISLPAGIAKMNFKKFFFFTLLGCIPWNIGLTYLGYTLGSHWNLVETYLKPLSYLIMALIVLWIVRFVYKVTREKMKR